MSSSPPKSVRARLAALENANANQQQQQRGNYFPTGTGNSVRARTAALQQQNDPQVFKRRRSSLLAAAQNNAPVRSRADAFQQQQQQQQRQNSPQKFGGASVRDRMAEWNQNNSQQSPQRSRRRSSLMEAQNVPVRARATALQQQPYWQLQNAPPQKPTVGNISVRNRAEALRQAQLNKSPQRTRRRSSLIEAQNMPLATRAAALQQQKGWPPFQYPPPASVRNSPQKSRRRRSSLIDGQPSVRDRTAALQNTTTNANQSHLRRQRPSIEFQPIELQTRIDNYNQSRRAQQQPGRPTANPYGIQSVDLRSRVEDYQTLTNRRPAAALRKNQSSALRVASPSRAKELYNYEGRRNAAVAANQRLQSESPKRQKANRIEDLRQQPDLIPMSMNGNGNRYQNVPSSPKNEQKKMMRRQQKQQLPDLIPMYGNNERYQNVSTSPTKSKLNYSTNDQIRLRAGQMTEKRMLRRSAKGRDSMDDPMYRRQLKPHRYANIGFNYEMNMSPTSRYA